MTFHNERRWHIRDVSRETLADLLAEEGSSPRTFTLCSGFRTPSGTLWVNDSASEDAIQEYAVLRPCSKVWRLEHPAIKEGWIQVDSITASWVNREKLLSLAEAFDSGESDDEDGVFATNYPPLLASRFEWNTKSEGNSHACDLCR